MGLARTPGLITLEEFEKLAFLVKIGWGHFLESGGWGEGDLGPLAKTAKSPVKFPSLVQINVA
jgi:hypothetical protein